MHIVHPKKFWIIIIIIIIIITTTTLQNVVSILKLLGYENGSHNMH